MQSFCNNNSFMSKNVARTGIMTYPNTKREKLLGGHAVLIVGYIKSKKLFVLNKK